MGKKDTLGLLDNSNKALSPSHPSTLKEDFLSECAREWVVGSEPTNDEGLGGVKQCEEWLLPGAQGMGAPEGGWAQIFLPGEFHGLRSLVGYHPQAWVKKSLT